MGLTLLNMLGLSSSVHYAHIACYWKVFLLHYTQVLCQYSLYRADHWFHLSMSLMLRQTFSWPVCLGIKHPSGVYDQSFITVRQLQVCWRGALSLTRGRVCLLQLLVLASAVILGSEPRGTRDHNLLSQIRDLPFRRLIWLAGLRWRYSTSSPHGLVSNSSQSHIATDGQSVSTSWCRAPSGAHDQIFIAVWQLRSCFCGVPSLTRGRVYLLYMPMALASAVFLGSKSLGTCDHILLSPNWDFLFVASYDSQGHDEGIRPLLHTGLTLFPTALGCSIYSLGADPQKILFPVLSPQQKNVACFFLTAGTCLPCSCLVKNVYSDSTTPALRRHVAIWKAKFR
jgi:hypothetical protein